MKFKKFTNKKIKTRDDKNNRIKVTTIIACVVMLIVSIVLFTYSAFNVTSRIDIMHAKVGNFIQTDYTIIAYVDGRATGVIPGRGEGYGVDHIECDNDATGLWHSKYWSIEIRNVTVSNTTCSIYFVTLPKPSEPELFQGLIPVKYNGSNIPVVADPNEEGDWYDYSEHQWANAVLVSNSSDYFENGELKQSKIGTSVGNIKQYYVWIPRYKYRLFNAENEGVEPQMIDIVFEDSDTTKSDGDSNGEWLTHPAFTFGDTELDGIWVGKFEMTGSVGSSSLTIVPNDYPLKSTITDGFDALRNLDRSYASNYGLDTNEIDTHSMKNTEWGAVAYLTSSMYGRYIDSSTCIDSGCEVWINSYYSSSQYRTITGYSGSSVSSESSNSGSQWNTNYGVRATTTGNQYGIYDMSGGEEEAVMGNVSSSSSVYRYNLASSMGGTEIQDRYLDKYITPNGANNNYSSGKLGDATRETLVYTENTDEGRIAWYSDYGQMASSSAPWFTRGGSYGHSIGAGIFAFSYSYNWSNNTSYAYRAVLCAQDGNNNDRGYVS